MKKKVLYIITKSNWGGAQRYVYDLATHLPREQFEPTVALGGDGILADKLRSAGIRVVSIAGLERDISLMKEVRAFSSLLKICRNEAPDIVHLNSSKAAAIGALAARLRGVPMIVFTAHGWAFKEDRGILWKLFVRFVSWLTVVLSTTVIVVSSKDKQIGEHMMFARNKISYVPLGITASDFLSREAARASLSINEHAPCIVTIAELTKNKGISYAIDAIAELKVRSVDCSYYIIGSGELREELLKRARDNGIANRVHFLGFVPDAARYLKAFDMFLLPSIKEGMPYVVLDAADAGMPIITTNIIDPLFGQLIVASKSSSDLADAVIATLQNPSVATSGLFTITEMVARTIGLYTTAPTISVSSRA